MCATQSEPNAEELGVAASENREIGHGLTVFCSFDFMHALTYHPT